MDTSLEPPLTTLNTLFLMLASLQLRTDECQEGFHYACLDGAESDQDWCADRLYELTRDLWRVGTKLLDLWDSTLRDVYNRGYADGTFDGPFD